MYESQFKKSSRSENNGCVEVNVRRDAVVVRDSKVPHGPALVFTAAEWEAFTTGLKEGEFDLPEETPAS